jgi:hypothetical protein
MLPGPPEQLVGVADHAWPSQLADPVHTFCWSRSHQGQIAAVHHEVGAAASDVGYHRPQRSPVAMNI